MATFFNALRPDPHYRREAFDAGMKAVGFKPADAGRCDVFIGWNRYGQLERLADQVEARGGRVLIAENASWGNDFMGGRWYSLWSRFHNRSDSIRYGGPERWDSLYVDLDPWRESGETVGLMQRGIGPRGTPKNWIPPGCDRIRRHPGKAEGVPLVKDLAKAAKVVTWGSGAAIKALMWGIKVESHMPLWAGSQDNTYAGRRAALQRLSWAQWRLSEIESGEPFKWLLF